MNITDQTTSGAERPRGAASRPLSVVVLVITTLLSVAVILYSINDQKLFRETIVELFQRHQLSISGEASQGIESLVNRLTRSMESVALSKWVSKIESPECRERIQEFYHANRDLVYAGYRMDRQGVLQYMYPVDESAIDVDISEQEHVQRLFKTRSLVVSSLFKAVEGFDAIAIHVPIYDEGSFDGSVATVIKLSKISELFVSRIKSGHSGYGWLVDENGMILVHPQKEYVGLRLADTDLFPKQVTDRLLMLMESREPGMAKVGDTLFALTPTKLGNRYWTVIVSAPYSDISEPIRRRWRNTWLVNAVLFFLLFLVGTEVSRAVRLEHEKWLLEEKVDLETDLRDSRDRLDMIVRTIPSGLYTLDKNRNILSWNDTAQALLGYTAEEVIGQHCSVFTTGDCAEGSCALYNDEAHKPAFGCECHYMRKDGRLILISKNIDFIRDTEGVIIGGIESFIDITEQRLAEKERINSMSLEREIDQLRQLDEVKSNFLSMVSHELRTPLSVMLGNLSMAQKGKYGELPETFMKKLDVVLRRGWQLNDLIASLLDLARIESGKLDLKKSKLDLKRALQDATNEVAEGVDKKSQELVTIIAEDASIVKADVSMFHRLMVNLLVNAVKYSPENGAIEIASENRDGFIVIKVSDNGIGIPEKAIPRVFERFYQVDDSSTRRYGGTGLGLAIAWDIMEVHGGRIEIESTEGEGTSVSVFFPTADPIPDLEKGQPGAKHGGNLKTPYFSSSQSIVYVGTDPDYLTALSELFDSTTHRIINVQDLYETTNILDREFVTALILDLDTVAIVNEELASWKQVIGGGSPLPLVAVSSNLDMAIRRKALDAGAVLLMGKPFDKQAFVANLKTLLK